MMHLPHLKHRPLKFTHLLVCMDSWKGTGRNPPEIQSVLPKLLLYPNGFLGWQPFCAVILYSADTFQRYSVSVKLKPAIKQNSSILCYSNAVWLSTGYSCQLTHKTAKLSKNLKITKIIRAHQALFCPVNPTSNSII